MKKIFSAAVLAAMALTASAQTWVGGSLGYNYNKTENEKAQNTLKIAPEIGYDLNETWSIAAALEYDFQKQGDKKTNVFTIKPYARYKFYTVGDVTFFVDGYVEAGFGKAKANGVNADLSSFGLGVTPGLAYGFCEKAGLVAHLGDLGYNFTKVEDAKNHNFGIGVNNTVSFGIYFNL